MLFEYLTVLMLVCVLKWMKNYYWKKTEDNKIIDKRKISLVKMNNKKKNTSKKSIINSYYIFAYPTMTSNIIQPNVFLILNLEFSFKNIMKNILYYISKKCVFTPNKHWWWEKNRSNNKRLSSLMRKNYLNLFLF